MAHAITGVYKVVEQLKKVKVKYREKHQGIKTFKQDLGKTMVFWTKDVEEKILKREDSTKMEDLIFLRDQQTER